MKAELFGMLELKQKYFKTQVFHVNKNKEIVAS